MRSKPARADWDPIGSTRAAFEDARALARLRRDLFEGMGPEHGRGILYALAFCEGMADGLRITQGFAAAPAATARLVGASIPMVFRPESGALEDRFGGTLPRSTEAALHQSDYPRSNDPVCFVSAGYAAGWYSAILGEMILVQELSCTAAGELSCRFEARRVEDWLDDNDPWTNELLPYLDFDTIRERAEQKSREPDEGPREGDMMGSFDPMSPAVHVWGPVMVLPYSGPEDSLVALDAVCEDVGRDQIRVVVVDVTGAMIDPIEVVGLTRLLDAFEAKNVETVMVGIGERGAQYFQSRKGALGLSLVARDISEAIALGFQISQSSRRPY